MANTEDYLDSLLNSINNTNMSGKSRSHIQAATRMIMPVKHSGNLSVNRNTNGNSAKRGKRNSVFYRNLKAS